MKPIEIVKRYALFVISLFFAALGVAFAKHGGLGVSPISSVANVMSYQFPALTLGSWLIIWNCVLIVGQIVILRSAFQKVQLLQIPLSFIFGWFTDLGMKIVSVVPVDSYLIRLAMVFIGIIVLGFGVSMAVIADVIMNSGEAFVKAISDTIHKDFGTVKVAFDVSCVVIAIVLSLAFFDFTIVGTREGTVITALLTGFVVKFFTGHMKNPLGRILSGKERFAAE